MGDLKRGDEHWYVYLETFHDSDLGAARGRVHFVGATESRNTSWIFLEWQEDEITERFAKMSPLELWSFVEALDRRKPD
jgi:hypothetical protein